MGMKVFFLKYSRDTVNKMIFEDESTIDKKRKELQKIEQQKSWQEFRNPTSFLPFSDFRENRGRHALSLPRNRIQHLGNTNLPLQMNRIRCLRNTNIICRLRVNQSSLNFG